MKSKILGFYPLDDDFDSIGECHNFSAFASTNPDDWSIINDIDRLMMFGDEEAFFERISETHTKTNPGHATG